MNRMYTDEFVKRAMKESRDLYMYYRREMQLGNAQTIIDLYHACEDQQIELVELRQLCTDLMSQLRKYE